MDYKISDEDKERIKLLNEIQKNKFNNLSLEQLILIERHASLNSNSVDSQIHGSP